MCARTAWCEGERVDTPCNGHGTCDNSTKKGEAFCVCDDHYEGENCEECESGYYGSSCKACADCGEHGKCKDGIESSGKCECVWYYVGAQCQWPWLWITLVAAAVVSCMATLLLIGAKGRQYLAKRRKERRRKELSALGEDIGGSLDYGEDDALLP
eukprot:TRINITY_DN2693_c0_g1_i2.p2 TRINITY_DN2693_c0_g1~~TRINITY_DN2693_c0_g1_i2.p2  ORF type:complete len:156 (+),score=43.61 TRINITY_DN2693_c0_g1_i2:119-586(+)